MPQTVAINTGKDREIILRWVDAKGASDAASVLWNALASEMAQLFREHPELKSAS